MSFSSGSLLYASDFTALKEKINTLMAKRNYGNRKMAAYKVTSSVSSSTRADASDANNLLNPYQRMISADASTNPSNAVSVGTAFNPKTFKDAETLVTKYLDFNKYHNNQTDSGCGGYCSGLCVTICANACKGCTGSCGSSCSSACIGSCSVACTSCTGCVSECATSCGKKCTGVCTSCSHTSIADEGCDCKGSCDGECYQGCEGYCNTSCSDGCRDQCGGAVSSRCTGCFAHCSDTCNDTCVGGCEGRCGTQCRGSCSGTCYNYGVGGTLCVSCVQACGTEAACEGQCTSTCFGYCSTTCGNNCSSSCGGDCIQGCTGSAQQFDWEPSSGTPYSHYINLTNYSSSSPFIVPSGVTSVYLFAVGGGAGSNGTQYGGTGGYKEWYKIFGSGGAGGGYVNDGYFTVSSGDKIYANVGTGGNGGTGHRGTTESYTSVKGYPGNPTNIIINGSTKLTAAGGLCCEVMQSEGSPYGGKGGSGGGDQNRQATLINRDGWPIIAGQGGFNGGDGFDFNAGTPKYSTKGLGQISSKPSSGSNGRPTTCKYNKVPYGPGGGAGSTLVDSRSEIKEYRTNGGAPGGVQGGGHGATVESIRGGASGLTSGTDGTGGGAGGTSSFWSVDYVRYVDGVRGGNGFALLYY